MNTKYFARILVLILLFGSMHHAVCQNAAKNTSVVAMCGCPGEIWGFNYPYKPYVSFPNPNNSKRLMHTDYGFNIPANATITGISVSFDYVCGATPANTMKDSLCMLYYNNTVIGNDNCGQTGFYSGTGSVTIGGPTDMWGTMLTPAEINSPLFGFNIKFFADAANSYFSLNNGAPMTVYYNLTSGISESQRSTPGIKVYLAAKELKIENNAAEKTSLEIFSLTGKKVFQSSFEKGASHSADLSLLEKGVYIYRVESETKSKVARIILE
jgi:hypothetical protein